MILQNWAIGTSTCGVISAGQGNYISSPISSGHKAMLAGYKPSPYLVLCNQGCSALISDEGHGQSKVSGGNDHPIDTHLQTY